ncbi:xylose isomerase [Bacillus sp. J14TS2]|uniref:sugar phosphate isomerase/epimerase family protein n=1 Tax=Bacillus sp. J14TS2 TaxID=2807188 RepID=UPI001B276B0C|nr:sugar phosphate isomerase/epimerase family protein [Bacillus sp. J14TS2]GIN71470.1 xylose isomerase [Bacillus sp. J14TS2]
MKLATQDQNFFPEKIIDKFRYLKDLGIDGYEIDGKMLVENIEEIKSAMEETGIEVKTACNGYDGWIGDFSEERRKNGLEELKNILYALQKIGGKGVVIPAAWGMFTYRLPPFTPPRNKEGDWNAISDSLLYLEKVAEKTNTSIYLEPLNRYQDHMINRVADAREYIEKNDLKHVKIVADFYHMNIEEDNILVTLQNNKELIGHIHLADNHRFQPGSGSINFKQCFDQLRANRYDGYLAIECRIQGEDAEHEFKKSLAYLKSILDC